MTGYAAQQKALKAAAKANGWVGLKILTVDGESIFLLFYSPNERQSAYSIPDLSFAGDGALDYDLESSQDQGQSWIHWEEAAHQRSHVTAKGGAILR